MDKAENSAHGYTEGAETPEAKELRHYMLYNRIAVQPDGMEFLKAVNEGITELKSLRSELQKQKELNAELVEGLKMARDLMKTHVPSSQSGLYVEWIEARDIIESLIKKNPRSHEQRTNNRFKRLEEVTSFSRQTTISTKEGTDSAMVP